MQPQEIALERLHELLEARESLRVIGAELIDSDVTKRGVAFIFESSEGEHVVRVQRADWHQLPLDQLGGMIAHKVVNEVRWRRYTGARATC